MNFNLRLKELLDEQEISARKLCEQIGIDHTSIYMYLQGGYPNLENAVKIANYFDCTLNFLFCIDELPNQYKFFYEYNAGLFFKRYTDLLRLNKISHYKVGKELKLGNSTFKKWQSGCILKIETLTKLSKYFGYSIDYLVGRSDT